MYLEKVTINNFRGIRHLSLDFNQDNTVLIGENTWGKSSLFRALWLVLGQGDLLCKFTKEDLYVPIVLNIDNTCESKSCEDLNDNINLLDEDIINLPEDENSDYLKYIKEDEIFLQSDIYKDTEERIEISLIFKEPYYGLVNKSRRLKRLHNAWNLGADGLYFIHWQIEGCFNDSNDFVTEHNLLDENGYSIDCDKERIIKLLISMNPLIRVRDGRYFARDENDDCMDTLDPTSLKNKINTKNISEEDLKDLAEDILKIQSEDSNAKEIMQGLDLINNLSKKYLGTYNQPILSRRNRKNINSIKDMVVKPVSIESLSNLKDKLRSPTFTVDKVISFCFISNLLMSKGDRVIDKHSKPILVLEDIESRFHPSLLLSFWSVISNMPLQKIISTNSGDFLTAVKISDIRHLSRRYYDTRCYKVVESNYSAEDLRRIAFHVRLNRPMSFFARVWLLVEGETEVWMLNQIAQILGVRLLCIGVRSVEFAQCGLHPLMHLASELGISFYVLTDGDEAGKKYAQSVMSYVGRRNISKHLTFLPNKDIEHYFFFNGFADVYYRAAKIANNNHNKKQFTTDKIIEIAIKNKSKPGLALSVCEEMFQRGSDSVPDLFKDLFRKILALSKNTI